MSASQIYAGRVVHNRPGRHRLSYAVFMLALDLDELPALDRTLRLFAHNRFGLLALFERDHGERSNRPIRPQIEAKLRVSGIGWEGGRIVLLTMPRVLNYVFNPLSVYFCYHRDGAIAALVHEVSNTFGERHFYVLPPSMHADGLIRQSCDKAFFVSPFLEHDLRYEFSVLPPNSVVSISLIVRRGTEIALTASFSGQGRALTDANIMRAWAGNPFMTLAVVFGIHWEALKMSLKGVRYLGRGSPSQSLNPPKHG